MKLGLVALAALLVAPATAAEPRPRQVAYVELFGKGGLGGLGYDIELGERVGAGLAASFYVLDDSRILSLSPYLTTWILGDGRHRWFVHAGPQIVRVSMRSPVPEWPGTTRHGVGVEVSSGWEYRARVVVRVFAMGTWGKGGFGPWLGVSFGWSR
jgi:hypothetical protein